MSLLSKAFESCRMLDKCAGKGIDGSKHMRYEPGKGFSCALVYEKSSGKKIGYANDVLDSYTVYLPLETTLNYHDVFMRLSDNKTFRITSNGSDKKPPEGAGIRYRTVTAEAFNCEVMMN